jgi:hypothetical protein
MRCACTSPLPTMPATPPSPRPRVHPRLRARARGGGLGPGRDAAAGGGAQGGGHRPGLHDHALQRPRWANLGEQGSWGKQDVPTLFSGWGRAGVPPPKAAPKLQPGHAAATRGLQPGRAAPRLLPGAQERAALCCAGARRLCCAGAPRPVLRAGAGQVAGNRCAWGVLAQAAAGKSSCTRGEGRAQETPPLGIHLRISPRPSAAPTRARATTWAPPPPPAARARRRHPGRAPHLPRARHPRIPAGLVAARGAQGRGGGARGAWRRRRRRRRLWRGRHGPGGRHGLKP